MNIQLILSVLMLLALSSCSYLEYAALQAEYRLAQTVEPGQANLKHMLDRQTYAVIGKTVDKNHAYRKTNLAIAAYSDKFKQHERVDTMHMASAGTHFGLNLPEGHYTLVATADINSNGMYEKGEIVSVKTVDVNEQTAPGMVLEGVTLSLENPVHLQWVESFKVPRTGELQKSLYYPAGTIRSLEDPIFDQSVATIGMYDPASFLERAPTTFYALEEDMFFKIPIIFVHGVDGTPRMFHEFIDKMDRQRYKALFYYYPSGLDLDLHADMFYMIFLSGKILKTGEMPLIIVAHSMGGLVVREALNRYSAKKDENRVELFFTLATPFGGHPSASTGEKYGPMVLPSWRDVNPQGDFLKKLYRETLPESVNHILLYAYHNPSSIKLNDNSDGVVPLASQLQPDAQADSKEQFGFNASHTDILIAEDVIDYVYNKAAGVENVFPTSHLNYLEKGGISDYPGIEKFPPLTQYLVENALWYMLAISDGMLEPFQQEMEQFYRAAQGRAKPESELEKQWVAFLAHYRSTMSESQMSK